MEHLYNPLDTTPLCDYFELIGNHFSNSYSSWMEFYAAIMSVSAASSIKLLKMMRSADVDLALAKCNLSLGYKHALCEYLTPLGKPEFVFAEVASTSEKATMKLCTKKHESQQQRMSLGNELGPIEVERLSFPPGLFHGINCSKQVPMAGKGAHGTEAVMSRVWCWAVGKWGNLHVDQSFCDRIGEMLEERWPYLKPWGGKPRDWSILVKNRFMNARGASEEAYKSAVIPKADLSSPAKRLLQDPYLALHVDDDAPSRYDLEELSEPFPTDSPAAEDAGAEPAHGVPVVGQPVRASRGDDFLNTGVPVACGVASAGMSSSAASSRSRSGGYGAHGRAAADADSSDDEDAPLIGRVARAPASASATSPPASRTKPLRRKCPAAPKATTAPKAPAPPATGDAASGDSAAVMPVKKRKVVAKKDPISTFSDSDLASEWSPLSSEEASAVGNDVKDLSGLGDPTLRVAKLFPLKEDDKHDWFLGKINTNLKLKHFFWVTFVDDLAEYRIHFYPKKYNQDWCFVRAKSTTAAC
jgi:hypothetical protein